MEKLSKFLSPFYKKRDISFENFSKFLSPFLQKLVSKYHIFEFEYFLFLGKKSLGPDVSKTQRVLTFFKDFQEVFPRLYRISMLVLRAPCSASDIERQFNISKMTLTDKRNRLEDRKLQQLMQMRTSRAFVAKLKEIIKN